MVGADFWWHGDSWSCSTASEVIMGFKTDKLAGGQTDVIQLLAFVPFKKKGLRNNGKKK
jgi:hypothetical protein